TRSGSPRRASVSSGHSIRTARTKAGRTIAASSSTSSKARVQKLQPKPSPPPRPVLRNRAPSRRHPHPHPNQHQHPRQRQRPNLNALTTHASPKGSKPALSQDRHHEVTRSPSRGLARSIAKRCGGRGGGMGAEPPSKEEPPSGGFTGLAVERYLELTLSTP